MINLFNIDCMDYMRCLPENYFDLAIPDPIYGINGNSHRQNKSRGRLAKSRDYHMAVWDYEITGPDYFELLFKKSKDQIIFGGNYFSALCSPFKTPRRNEADKFIKENPTGWILWDKVNGTTGFNDFEMIWTSLPIKTHIYYFMWNGFMQGKSVFNGAEMNPNKNMNANRIHPTQKPIQVYQYLLSIANMAPNHRILDTHGGSMSSAIAAHEMGLNITVLEIDEIYYQKGLERVVNAMKQLKMFEYAN